MIICEGGRSSGKTLQACFILLRKYRNQLTRQQVKTFKGQILSGDYEAFKKGLKKVLTNKT